MAIVLDTSADITLNDEQAEHYFNEIRRLRQLRIGLEFLYSMVRTIEQHLEQQDQLPQFVFGRAPEMENVPLELIECAFHWYAVSVCSHCGLIAKIAEEVIPKATPKWCKYRQNVCGSVLTYRNKVAAHFARVRPRQSTKNVENGDNLADIERSVMHGVALEEGRFTVGRWHLVKTRGDRSARSRHDYHWSLTLFHERIAQRYELSLR